jgi:hypothetical protein
MAWGSLIHPALAEILTGRYSLTVTADELRGLEKGGLDKILEQMRSTQGFTGTAEAADEIGRELLRRLVKEFATLGFTVNEAEQRDLLGVMRTDLSTRRITERTLNLLTVGALVNFICAKLGPRLRAA